MAVQVVHGCTACRAAEAEKIPFVGDVEPLAALEEGAATPHVSLCMHHTGHLISSLHLQLHECMRCKCLHGCMQSTGRAAACL